MCARAYRDGILSVVDDSGYPFSVRVQVAIDDVHERLVLSGMDRSLPFGPGPACVAFHRHDEHLENQYQLLVRGQLILGDGTLLLRPSAFVTANGEQDTDRMPHAGAPLQLVRFMLLGQKQARAYLRRRQRPWPKIDFSPMLRVVRESKSGVR